MPTIPFYYEVAVKVAHEVAVKVAHIGKQGSTAQTRQIEINENSYSTYASIVDAVQYASTNIADEHDPSAFFVIDITLQSQRLERLHPQQWKPLAVGLIPNLAEKIYNTLKQEGAVVQDLSKVIIQTVLDGEEWKEHDTTVTYEKGRRIRVKNPNATQTDPCYKCPDSGTDNCRVGGCRVC